ncbi:MAG: hypothetical protein IJR80_07780 [Treponema sp.]|nr:hypothetical protein [Treponema sp.]
MKTSLAGIAAGLLLFSACNLSVPESFSVKTNANYNYSIGNISQDFSESFKASNLFSGLETDHNKIYDYFPGQEDDKLQQYLLTIKVDEFSLENEYTLQSKTPGTELSFTIPTITVDMDISSIFDSIRNILGDSFVDNAVFRAVPLYIYCGQPSGFSESELKGKVIIKYVDENNTTLTETTIGQADKEIPYKITPEINITTVGQAENVVDTSLQPVDTSMNGDIKIILNENRSNKGKILLQFELNFTGTTNDDPLGSLAISAFLVIPFKFDITGVIDISLIDLAKDDSDKSNADIFNRDKATDTKEIQKYLDVIEAVEINYKTSKNPIVTDSNTRYVIKSELPYIRRELDINADTEKITNEELMDMLSVYPFDPALNLNIPSGAILSLPRNLGLEMNMSVSLYTNGIIKL